jgi:hypothetical protein
MSSVKGSRTKLVLTSPKKRADRISSAFFTVPPSRRFIALIFPNPLTKYHNHIYERNQVYAIDGVYTVREARTEEPAGSSRPYRRNTKKARGSGGLSYLPWLPGNLPLIFFPPVNFLKGGAGFPPLAIIPAFRYTPLSITERSFACPK